ncbi:MAG: 50S ribosomal protein L4 [Omnitrophica bacterium RIFCSPLOWO2_12_FULL_44_17]|uniref:Large ribosomal subunit protein uL4 n=1 Tax=Candidatus Danuiimicrobium aquiferis TaxID=1801832 RepID=A0A1G1KZY3_9BACT|nr:MAG: 50S ribosomal protein L4 [Omnitrophica bacterium RIFCSPHIGHO2_02_FULL_45_28]OGW91762.1 MAG: 50S ribosomal protein L4 [Omnitrophica bacterium RIFCSPHIGHO2_12_FULL_44_12]OGW98466.1 MAG: 50S ribosomal protein L4 [Omnitrophica bacterium RIFCSPLOWO2_12_FULL_44_17]OGX02913.1 MAG: 50S ribosomal protein L4 [Omnitrophica bacterium RIFCSPLOWO2_02_FULL_44_11]
MLTAIVYQQDGKTNGEVELNPKVFGARVNDRLLELALIAYAGNQRRGTHATKTRGEVRGGGKKPWKQKGTGRARHGSRRSPIWRGGGTVFGPHPRDYGSEMSAQMKRVALISALSLKKKSDDVMVLENLELKQPKTKELVNVIKALKLENARTLFVVDSMNEALSRASRNLKKYFSIRRASDVNSYHVQRRVKLLIDKQALLTLEKRALGEAVVAEEKTS